MFGDRALASVRPSEVQAWVRGLEQHLAPATIEVVYSFLAGIFRAAVRDRLLVISPCVDVRLPKPEPKRVEPLATEKVEALIEAMPARYRALVMVAAGTGLRQGEAFAVEVEAIDFLRRMLRVDRQLVLLPGREPYTAPPKTPASYPGRCRSPRSSSTRWRPTWRCSPPLGWRSWMRHASRTRSGDQRRWCSPP
jgi:integrase